MYPSFSKNLGPVSLNDIKHAVDCDIENIQNNHTFNELLAAIPISSIEPSFSYILFKKVLLFSLIYIF